MLPASHFVLAGRACPQTAGLVGAVGWATTTNKAAFGGAQSRVHAKRAAPQHDRQTTGERPLRRAKRRRKNDCLVTSAECARTQTPDAPLPPPSLGAHLKAGGCSPLSLLTFFAAAKKVSAAPHRGNTNKPKTKKGKAKKQKSKTEGQEQPLRRAKRRRKNDCLVTSAKCARTQTPDAPLPPPSEGPASKLAVAARFLCLLSLRRQRK
jgi:hypothetical protein